MRQGQIEFFKILASEANLENLLDRFLKLILETQNVERGSIWIKKESAYLCLRAAGEEFQSIQGLIIPAGKPSIVGWVIENGLRTVAEADRDERHYAEAEKGLKVKSSMILAFPLVLRDGSVYGCAELIDVSPGGRHLNLEDKYLDLTQNLIDACSIALSGSEAFAKALADSGPLPGSAALDGAQPLIKGPSKVFNHALRLAESYSATDYPVLITGESGTGKEVLAREIHRRSARANKPFLVQNCSAIPSTLLASELFGYMKGAFTGALGDKQGLFEAANGGTVFLDEIGDMGVDLQASLLRALQDGEIKPLGSTESRKVDVRVVSATNKDLHQAIKDGLFRQDLYFRLKVLPLYIPPLRERMEDIPYFLNHFITREAERLKTPARRISDAAMNAFMDYDWPGNVRELENMVKQIMATSRGEEILARDLPPHLPVSPGALVEPGAPLSAPALAAAPAAPPAPVPENMTWREMERAYILRLLEKNRWVISRAAQDAGLKRSTFDSRMKKLGIRKKPD